MTSHVDEAPKEGGIHSTFSFSIEFILLPHLKRHHKLWSTIANVMYHVSHFSTVCGKQIPADKGTKPSNPVL